MSDEPTRAGVHQGQPVLAAGAPLAEARAALVMVHGRGASAEDILSFSDELARPGLALLAPQASGHTWYPYSFLAPLDANEPYLSSALAQLDAVVARVVAAGIPTERIVLLGFSQGACLMLEYAARHAQRYGGLVGWSGGLIGPDGTPRVYAGALARTPVFLGCSTNDPHVPEARVNHTAEVLRGLGAVVDERIYPGLGHTVNQDELDAARALVTAVAA
ncbi:MAG TPA: alpha/beta hydrolase [Ktedonobacterales bacterium]|nr:alpha/beta hydrolase [Ktedonobacterales bacterium]